MEARSYGRDLWEVPRRGGNSKVWGGLVGAALKWTFTGSQGGSGTVTFSLEPASPVFNLKALAWEILVDLLLKGRKV